MNNDELQSSNSGKPFFCLFFPPKSPHHIRKSSHVALQPHFFPFKNVLIHSCTFIKQIACARHCVKCWAPDRVHELHYSSYCEQQSGEAESLLENESYLELVVVIMICFPEPPFTLGSPGLLRTVLKRCWYYRKSKEPVRV